MVSLTSGGILSLAISPYRSTFRLTADTRAQTGLGLAPTASVEAGSPVVSVEADNPVSPTFILTQDQIFTIGVDGRPGFDITVFGSSTTNNTIANATSLDTTQAQMLAGEIDTALDPVKADLVNAGLPLVMVTIDPNTDDTDLHHDRICVHDRRAADGGTEQPTWHRTRRCQRRADGGSGRRGELWQSG